MIKTIVTNIHRMGWANFRKSLRTLPLLLISLGSLESLSYPIKIRVKPAYLGLRKPKADLDVPNFCWSLFSSYPILVIYFLRPPTSCLDPGVSLSIPLPLSPFPCPLQSSLQDICTCPWRRPYPSRPTSSSV